MVQNIQIQQTTLEEKVQQIQALHGLSSEDKAFQALAVSLLFDVDYGSILPDEIVDATQDKQIDVIRIEEDSRAGQAHIHIIQAKNSPGFSSNTLIQMRNGLGWIFSRPKAELETLSNSRFVNKIEEIRDLRSNYSTSNLSVSVYYITPGDARILNTPASDEWNQEKRAFVAEYSAIGFQNFEFKELGATELVGLLNESERIRREIDAKIAIVYDVNRPSLVEYQTGDTKAVICTVTGEELARIASLEPRDAIFDLNVRPYYGLRGKVNSEVHRTSTSVIESPRFWFLNNGITMICTSFSVDKDPDNPTVQVNNVQIVNGCQTSVTLREAKENGVLQADVRVLLRIYSTADQNLVEEITLTTNNQNRITDRDLKANDVVQRDIQRAMRDLYGYHYERKNKEFRALRGDEQRKVIPNDRAAQAFLAIVLRRPSVARGYLARIWSEHYDEIFSRANVEDLLLSYQIYSFCADKAKTLDTNFSWPDPTTMELAKEVAVYGVFHLSTLIGAQLTRNQWGARNQRATKAILEAIWTDGDQTLSVAYDRVLIDLVAIRNQSLADNPYPLLYFKALDIERRINQVINGPANTNATPS